jgi:hypothetical protein
MKKIGVLLFTLVIVNLAKGNEFPDSLYLHLYNYQVIKGELEGGLDLSNLRKSFNIEVLVDNTNTKTFSIFKFYHLKYEDPITSFLVIEKDKTEIYDILSFDILIEKIFDVSSIDEKSKSLWTKEIFRILRNFFEIYDMERLVIKKDFGKYHYFIPLTNLKNKQGIINP